MIGRDEDEGLVADAELLELLDGGADGIVHLEKLTEGTVVVKSVHLLVDGGTLGHEEETLATTTLVEDFDGLEGHLLEAGNVSGGAVLASGIVLELLDVVLVDVAVQPDGEVALAEDTEGGLADVGGLEGSVVQADGVALLGKLLVVVQSLVGALAGEELLSTATEEDVGATLVGPGVVGDTVEGLVNESTVLGTATAVAGESNGSGIGKEGSGDGTPSTILGSVSFWLCNMSY